jgi:hypothetical protein
MTDEIPSVCDYGTLILKMVFRGHQYEVLLDTKGQWRGMVHIFDAEMLHDPFNGNVLMTGAWWDWTRGTIVMQTGHHATTTYRDHGIGWDSALLVPAAETIRRELAVQAKGQN